MQRKNILLMFDERFLGLHDRPGVRDPIPHTSVISFGRLLKCIEVSSSDEHLVCVEINKKPQLKQGKSTG